MSKIAVFIPVHNEEAFIERTVLSVLAQDFADFELIISENHSTDGTLAKLSELKERDSRVKVLQPQQKLNSYGNFCFLADQVNQGNYFASMMVGGHDLLSHNVLSSSVKHLTENPSCAIVYQRNSFEIDEEDKVTRKWPGCHESGNMNSTFDAILTLISLMYNTPIFGLWRQQVRNDVQYRHPCVGGDHLYIAEVAIHGSITAINDASMYLRRAPPNANYLEKHFTAASGDAAAAKDMYVQLSWLSDIIDQSTQGQPNFVREMYRNSAISLYLVRYNHHFATFGSTLNAFASMDGVSSYIKGNMDMGVMIKELIQTNINQKTTPTGPIISTPQ
jgi:glycosyltransferase involved in cell wall biosynthesis